MTYTSLERWLLTLRWARHSYKGLESCLTRLFLFTLSMLEFLPFTTVLYSTL